jgi:acyl carrier protein
MSEDAAFANRVIGLLIQRLGLPPDIVTPTSELAEDLGIDSVDSVEFTLALEREFSVSLPDTALADVKTVQDVIDLVRERIGAPT